MKALEEHIDVAAYEIPAHATFNPYIENAIWHGVAV